MSRRVTNSDRREVATAVGQAFSWSDGALRFRHVFRKKPRGWVDSDKIERIDPRQPDILKFEWSSKGAKGTGQLTRAK